MTPLQAALGYISVGWRVAPALPGQKHPCIPEWQTRATTDVNTIVPWFTTDPDRMNVCIATGEASGIWVLDIDDKQPCELDHDCHAMKGSCTLTRLEVEHGELPRTYVVGTGSGGTHYYFSWEGVDFDLRNSAGRLGPGVDTRGNGGQVVAPPSRCSDPTHFQSYTVLSGAVPVPAPRWLTWLLKPQARPAYHGPRPEAFLPGGHDGILGWLASLRPGEQDQGAAWVVRALRDEGKTAQEARDLLWSVMQTWECSRGPWTPNDAERHVRSAYRM